jgi:hypothetical protein
MIRKPWMAFALAGLITFAAFLPSLGGGFVWDDDGNLVDNPSYRGLAPANLEWMFTHFRLGHYQPLSWVTLGLDYSVWGMNPLGYHLTNVVLHALSAAVLAGLCARLLAGRSEGGASRAPAMTGGILVALAWSLHPLRVEAVSWVTQRREVLCGLLSLLALSGHLRGRPWWSTAALALLAMLAKVTAVTIPCLLVLADLWRAGGPGAPGAWRAFGRSLLRHAPLFASAAVFVWVASLAQREANAMVSTADLPVRSRLALTLYGAAFCVMKTLWPAGLAPLHQGQIGLTWNLEPFVWWTAGGALAVLLAAGAIGWRLRRRVPGVLVLAAAFVVLVVPAGGLGQSGPQVAAERYTYQPAWVLTFGIGWLLAAAVRRFALPSRAGLAAAGIVLAGLAALAIGHQRHWRDTESLWRHELDVYPRSAFGNFVLVSHYVRLVPPRFDLAEAPLRAAVAIQSDYVDAEKMLAGLLFSTARPGEAVAVLERFTREHPENSEAWRLLGRAQAAASRPKDALATFEQGIEAAPSPDLRREIAWILATHPDPGVRDGRRALEMARQAVAEGTADAKMAVMFAAAAAETGDFDTARRVVLGAIEHLPPAEQPALRQLLADLERRQPVRAEPRFP